MKRCKYCNKICWPWQSWSWEIAEITNPDMGYKLVHTDYEKDIYAHDSCIFFRAYQDAIREV